MDRIAEIVRQSAPASLPEEELRRALERLSAVPGFRRCVLADEHSPVATISAAGFRFEIHAVAIREATRNTAQHSATQRIRWAA